MVVNLTNVFSALVRPRLVLSSCSLQLLIADSERSSSGSFSDAEYSSRSLSFSRSFVKSQSSSYNFLLTWAANPAITVQRLKIAETSNLKCTTSAFYS